jgi:hypothetical protein
MCAQMMYKNFVRSADSEVKLILDILIWFRVVLENFDALN